MALIPLKVMSVRLSIVVKSLKYSNFKYQVEVEWDITQRCNYSCSYCASYDNAQPFNFKTLDEYIESFKYLSELYGNQTISLDLLGGEPTLFKQWVELVNWMIDNNFYPKITTNLSIPVEKYVDKLNPNLSKFINASYHGEFATLGDFYQNAKLLEERGFLKGISLLADPKNWEYTKFCYKRLSEVSNTTLTRIKNEFSGTYSLTNKFISYTDEQEKLFRDNPTQDSNYTIELEDGTIIHPSTYEIRNKYSNFKGMMCAVGQQRLHIKTNGDVYPSACLLKYSKAKMGNIFERNIKKPRKAIVCPFTECLCGPDIRIEKWTQL